MSDYTSKLNLYKVDPAIDGEDTFNIKSMMNDNWDKIDEKVGNMDEKLSGVEDNANNYNHPDTHDAEMIRIQDESGKFIGDNVEDVLGEVGSQLADIANEQEDFVKYKSDSNTYQIPTIVGTQIQLQRQSDTKRLFFKLSTDLTGGDITISLDGGVTSNILKNIDDTNVIELSKGFVEVVEEANFFIYAPKGRGSQDTSFFAMHNKGETTEIIDVKKGDYIISQDIPLLVSNNNLNGTFVYGEDNRYMNALVYNDNYIFFNTYNSSKKCLVRYNWDGTDMRKLKDTYINDITLIGDRLYYSPPGSVNELRSMKLDGTDDKLINSGDDIIGLITDGKRLYYANWSDGGKLYRIDIDGNNRVKLNDKQIHKIAFNPRDGEDRITYITLNGYYYDCYMINTDGSKEVKITSFDKNSCISINPYSVVMHYTSSASEYKAYISIIGGSQIELKGLRVTTEFSLSEDRKETLFASADGILYSLNNITGRLRRVDIPYQSAVGVYNPVLTSKGLLCSRASKMTFISTKTNIESINNISRRKKYQSYTKVEFSSNAIKESDRVGYQRIESWFGWPVSLDRDIDLGAISIKVKRNGYATDLKMSIYNWDSNDKLGSYVVQSPTTGVQDLPTLKKVFFKFNTKLSAGKYVIVIHKRDFSYRNDQYYEFDVSTNNTNVEGVYKGHKESVSGGSDYLKIDNHYSNKQIEFNMYENVYKGDGKLELIQVKADGKLKVPSYQESKYVSGIILKKKPDIYDINSKTTKILMGKITFYNADRYSNRYVEFALPEGFNAQYLSGIPISSNKVSGQATNRLVEPMLGWSSVGIGCTSIRESGGNINANSLAVISKEDIFSLHDKQIVRIGGQQGDSTDPETFKIGYMIIGY
ncbi:DUF5050 domain-containing protein [Vallitalea guaymasensis]|uniref:DUF5050 domain-containing protein n=1 Tax=Vallitalea guaymasensis TaxID=1185412 RepID=A0A8J8SCP3_9FIRM|nr:DUF5050 domain-containing protein [Vallitalea guaymasensis]QUH29651.1 DUF5050 domain-containing protein [Vallitalea guaymasensis]